MWPMFSFSILSCCHIGNHPLEDLMPLGYKQAMKVEIY
jgi:hypothetical protein